MKREIKHYNIDNLVSKNADINILFGERSNGKSYQLKYKRAVIKYLETGKRFILLRRFREEITSTGIEQYFQDVDVAKITDNKYNCITQYRKVLYFSNYSAETFKTTRGEKIRLCYGIINRATYVGSFFS